MQTPARVRWVSVGSWWGLPATQGTKQNPGGAMTDAGANCGSPRAPDPVRHAASGRESRHYAEAFPRERFQGGGLVLTPWLRGGLGAERWLGDSQPGAAIHATAPLLPARHRCLSRPRHWLLLQLALLISSKRKFSGTACQTSPGLSPRAGKPTEHRGWAGKVRGCRWAPPGWL